MIKNENIICISTIDWDFIWQGHQEIMSTLAKHGNRVIFIENTGVRSPGISDFPRLRKRIKDYFKGVKGIRKEMDNLYVFSPVILPFPYLRLARWINKRLILSILKKWMSVVDFSDPIVWTFLPTPLSLELIKELTNKLTIYYCIDNFRVSSAQACKIEKSERKLLNIADLVFVTSNELYKYCLNYSGKVHLFPFAVSYEKFEKARLSKAQPLNELKNIKKPIIGYVGGIHKWIDQGLIKNLALKYKDFSFVFIGPIQTDISLLSGIENIYFLGKKEHSQLPFFINNFDTCIIPYLAASYTKNVYPTKLNEYLAMGKSIVSTNLPEIEAFNEKHAGIVYVADNYEEFSACLDKAIFEDRQDLRIKRIEAAKQNSWSNTIENMSILINAEIERKKLETECTWKEKLIKFYKKTRNNTFVFITACLLAYIILFKTPFVWFLAEPLKISQPLQKANVIVVFGGGVGETGNPGKSTIERARYASELYRKGLADKIIFSSGYAYKYNDAENMRLIALSMGVRDQDIFLEKKSGRAYENVIFSKEILDKNGWGSILLVSSPYNMLRVSLVFNKVGNKIKIICAPVKECQFYDRDIGISLEQGRAILHEYLGIVYYWWKGWI